jgi:hypothetical protein
VTGPCEDWLTTRSSLPVKYSLSLPVHNVDRSIVVTAGMPSDAVELLKDHARQGKAVLRWLQSSRDRSRLNEDHCDRAEKLELQSAEVRSSALDAAALHSLKQQ